jgi:ribose/xylose/arabinose/galactoside ABC-type transport system permease subunit
MDADSTNISAAAGHPRHARNWARLIKRHPAANIILVFACVQLGCLTAWLVFPDEFRYLSVANIAILLRSIPLLGTIAIGVGILMIAGEFDLSVGAVFILTSYLMALAYGHGWPLSVAVTVAVVVAVMCGLANGLITVRLQIPSFITTLGSMLFLRGIIRFVSDSRPVMFQPDSFTVNVLTGSLGFIQVQFLWLVLLAVFAYLLLMRHKLGNHIFMVGGNRKAAIAVGVNADRVKVICFVISALCASAAGIVSAVRVSSVTPSGGIGMELQAIAACVVGGLSLYGGRGTVLGIFLGASLLNIIEDVLLLIRAPGYYLDMFVGAIIVIAVVMNRWVERRT